MADRLPHADGTATMRRVTHEDPRTGPPAIETARRALALLRHDEAEAMCLQHLRARGWGLGTDASGPPVTGSGIAEWIEVLAVTWIESGRRDEAIDLLADAIGRMPSEALRALHARQLLLDGRGDAALEALARWEAEGATDGDDVAGLRRIIIRAECFERLGRPEDALAAVEPHLAGAATPSAVASVAVRVMDRAGDRAGAIALGRDVAGRAPTDEGARDVLFSTARLLERSGDVDGAFAAATQANAIGRAPFDPIAYKRFVGAIERTFDAATMERLRSLRGARATRPAARSAVFVVGAPRCGSTLLERMLAMHPDVVGLGEIADFHRIVTRLPAAIESSRPYPAAAGDLTADAIERLADDYLASIERRAPEAPRRINKDLNVLLSAGLVDILLPGATVIRVHRDRVDHGLAIWLERLRPSSVPWASDLRWIGRVLGLHDRLAAHWAAVVESPFLDVAYEDILRDPRAEVGRVLEAMGLPWDDACLAFDTAGHVDRTLSYDQTRRPLSTASVGRAAAYGPRLDPLRRALGVPEWADAAD